MAKKKAPVKVKKAPVKKAVKNIRAGDMSAHSAQTALLANKMLAAKKVVNKNKGVSPAELAYNIAKSQVASEKDTPASIFEETSARITEHLDSKNQRVNIGYKQTVSYNDDPTKITLMPYCMTYVNFMDIVHDNAGIHDKVSSSVGLYRAREVMKTFLEEEDIGVFLFTPNSLANKIGDIQKKMNDIRWQKSFDTVTREEMDILRKRVENIPGHISVVVDIQRQYNCLELGVHRVDVGLWDVLCKEQPSFLLNQLEKPISEMKPDRNLVDVCYTRHYTPDQMRRLAARFDR
jgi:hypothetical protein